MSFNSLKHGFRRTFLKADSGNVTAHAAEAELTENLRQSKLSQEQLSELQRSTHFDKKELQQWYKGEFIIIPESSVC